MARDFIASEAGSGVVLIAAAIIAILAANITPTATLYEHALHAVTGPILSPALGPMTVHLWINDGLMALFFLLVGLEIKREFVEGRLASPRRRRLPFLAAAAGMAVPALVYLAIAGAMPELVRGWAIPAATDIAFAIGIMALLGSRVPGSLKLFLTAVAIVDDMGAVAIIAVVYTVKLDLAALAAATGVLAIMFAMNRRGVVMLWPYLLGFAAMWFLLLISGVHATIAGVAAAAVIPITKSSGAPESETSPLHRLEHALQPWVAYGIVPIFAFANAGVSLAGAHLGSVFDPLVMGIAAGLFFGKQIGIFGAVWLAERTGFAAPPQGTTWMQIYGASLVAGIGFTMSLFIGDLAFPTHPEMVERVKLGVLAGSLVAALAGYLVLRFARRASA